MEKNNNNKNNSSNSLVFGQWPLTKRGTGKAVLPKGFEPFDHFNRGVSHTTVLPRLHFYEACELSKYGKSDTCVAVLLLVY